MSTWTLIPVDLTKPNEKVYTTYIYSKSNKQIYHVESHGLMSVRGIQVELGLTGNSWYTKSEMPKYIAKDLGKRIEEVIDPRKVTEDNWDYKSIVWQKSNPLNKKEVLMREKIKGLTYGYDSLKSLYDQMNKEYPDFCHEVINK